MFKISDLARRDIINLSDGSRLGPVKDIHIDSAAGNVVALVLKTPKKKYMGLMSAGQDIVVPWDKIRKIGVDAVLVDVDAWQKK
ncbi:sporulation protein, YlmC/YmxH family [Desulfofarcimen acetoxidans DSM 771]|uniref:Sporulation protein, YlmC/YmxH family n=1 Tax=Desulfofarcimen acetoxidans (strain ATCC 49208 / DSM 771 / KCTC 5769 / VKM B-1644 / 5575) TaxID=485916 RepID=C8VYQ5_DESAS|nr:YlmC/YmxH family sporulation protein [Desulfofarcimen acetoxidans]ACV64776.1 sporulation protein, YlmC/YmxH family [Desulfofarcimen acetoxidans DSM 771]